MLDRKVTPLVFLAFFAALIAMSALAAGIGYLTHYYAKRPNPVARS